MKTYELTISDESEGMDFISLVRTPAMESSFVAFSEATPTPKITCYKQMLTRVVCIPNKQIYRKNESGEEFFVYFSEQSIEKMRDRFMKSEINRNINVEHDSKLENHYITEMWIVENPEIDKAKHLGFNVPKGTLMASIKVDNTEIWESLILTGKVAGFSLEGKFNHKIMDKQEEKQEFKSDRSIMEVVYDLFKKNDRIKALTNGRKIAQKQVFSHAGETISIMPEGQALRVSQQSLQNTSRGVAMTAATDGKYVNAETGEAIDVIDGIAYMGEEASKEVWTVEGFHFIINNDGTVVNSRGNAIADGVYTLENGVVIEITNGVIKTQETQGTQGAQAMPEISELKTQFASQTAQMNELRQMVVQLTQVIQTTTKAQTPNINADSVPTQPEAFVNFSDQQLKHRENSFRKQKRS